MLQNVPPLAPPPGEIITVLPDDYEAAAMLAELRWNDGFRCRNCEGTRATHLRCRPRVFECRLCGAFNSVTAGTVLHRTRLPLGKVILAFHLVSRVGGVSANRLRLILGTRYGTAWRLAHRLRHALAAWPNRVARPTSTAGCGLWARRKRDERTRQWPHLVQLVASGNGTGRVGTGLCTGDLALTRHRLLEGALCSRWSPRHQADPALMRQVFGLRSLLTRTHRRVSRRWMRRYVEAWAALEGRPDRLRHLANCVFAGEPMAWRTLVPVPMAPLG